MSTQQDQAIAVANQMFSAANQCSTLASQLTALHTTWTNLSVANKLNAMPTAPLLTTGALGTPDGSPNTANPIDTRVSGLSGISKAMSANNVASLDTYLQGIISAIGGGAISANGSAPQLLALCT